MGKRVLTLTFVDSDNVHMGRSDVVITDMTQLTDAVVGFIKETYAKGMVLTDSKIEGSLLAYHSGGQEF